MSPRPGVGVALHLDPTAATPRHLDGGRRLLLAPADRQLAPNLLPVEPYGAIDLLALADVAAVPAALLAHGRDRRASPPLGVFEQLSSTRRAATPPAGSTLPAYPDVAPGPPAVVVIFSQPRSLADDAEYNRWYDHVHGPETLMLPGFTRARRFRLAADTEQLTTDVDWPHQPYLTIYDVDNVNAVPTARAAMSWFKGVSAQFASPALDVPPACWTYVSQEPTDQRAPRPAPQVPSPAPQHPGADEPD